MMPKQLAIGRRQKHSKPRPIVESLPSIAVKELKIPSIYDRKVYVLQFKFLPVASITVGAESVDFHHKPLHRGQLGEVQTFKVKRIPTYGTGFRRGLYCHCGRAVLRLFYHGDRVACRHCIKAIYASQACDQRQRPILQATRIQDFLDNHPRLMRKTRDRLRKRLGDKLMRAQTRLNSTANMLSDILVASSMLLGLLLLASMLLR
jgi:hypothetical protein